MPYLSLPRGSLTHNIRKRPLPPEERRRGTCEVCGKSALSIGCWGPEWDEAYEKDGLCGSCRGGVSAAQEQKVSSYLANYHPGHDISDLRDGPDGTKFAICWTCHVHLIAPVKPAEFITLNIDPLKPFVEYTPPVMKR